MVITVQRKVSPVDTVDIFEYNLNIAGRTLHYDRRKVPTKGISRGHSVKIAVIDGLGGGLGCQIIENLKKEIINDRVEIIALGTNSGATSNMLKSGAQRGATGENAIRVTTRDVDIIAGPIGIIIPNSMMGEITTAIAEAVFDSSARKFVLANNQPHVELVGIEEQPVNMLVRKLVFRIKEYIESK